MANDKMNMLSFVIGDEICNFWGSKCAMFGPQNDFLGAYGDETLFIAQLAPSFFCGHFLAYKKINVLPHEIGDEICHFFGTKCAIFGPQNNF